MNSFPMFKWLIRGLAVSLGLTLAWTAAARARSQDGPKGAGVLAKVPADATAFLHIKAADIWRADAVAGFREMLTKAGPEAMAAFNKRFLPAPATLESATVYVLPPGEDGPAAVGALLAFSEDFDQAKVLKSLLPEAKERNHFGQTYMEDLKAELTMKIVNGRTLLVSNNAMMPRLLAYDAKDTGAMTQHFAAAANKAVYAALDMAALPKESFDQIPDAFRPLTTAKEAVLSGELGKELALKLTVRYADAVAASEADQAARDGLKLARTQMEHMIQDAEKKVTSPPKDKSASLTNMPEALNDLMALASIKSLDQIMANPPMTKQGDSLVMEYRFDPSNPQTVASTMAMAIGVMVPAVTNTKMAATRMQGQNNLKQLAIAMHSYHAETGTFPAHAIYTKDKKRPLLSWRVSLLPYLDQDALYKQFKLDEPWDSDDNKKLIAKMPAVFADPDATATRESGQTHYQAFVGGGAGFRVESKGTKLVDIVDGTSTTIMFAVATNPVTWTKPDDLTYAANKPLPKLGIAGKAFSVAMFDGAVKSIEPKTPERVIRAMITMAGGELIGDD
jgi:Protein of unknown function (DUF1559)